MTWDLAVAAGATPEGLAPGHSLRAQAESLAQAGQKPEAAVLFERATSLWAAAVPPSQSAPNPGAGDIPAQRQEPAGGGRPPFRGPAPVNAPTPGPRRSSATPPR